jgi:hypothetical protein
MGTNLLRLFATYPGKQILSYVAAVVLAFSASATFAAGPLEAQKKNAQPIPALQQNRADADELPVTAEDLKEKKRKAARAALVEQMRAKAAEEVEAAARRVPSPDAGLLARALGVEIESTTNPGESNPAASALRQLEDLDQDGAAEVVFRWSRLERFKSRGIDDSGPLPGWVLFLLSWDGARWKVSELMTGDGLCGLDTLEGIWPIQALVAVEGLSSMPYPVVFRFDGHVATVAWDSRDENSRYQGYAGGTVQFDERGSGPPAMIVSGRADPGVIRFSPSGDRGFQVATVYLWEGGAYVPKKSEFEENEDYTLYRFLSALHLRDFRTAYSLIQPAQFLSGSDKTVEAFRKEIEDRWRELIGNSIFEAIDGAAEGQHRFAFVLRRSNGDSTYFPEFSSDGRFLLTGLERRDKQ